jgi:hypothetical protein
MGGAIHGKTRGEGACSRKKNGNGTKIQKMKKIGKQSLKKMKKIGKQRGGE